MNPLVLQSKNVNLLRVIILACFAVLAIGIWCAVFRADREGKLTVAFLDVGQGDAIYIEAPNGNQLLVDGGPNTGTLRALGKVMPFYDRSLDVVLATHPDMDHVGGLPEVIKRMHVDTVVTTDATADTGAYGEFAKRVSDKQIEHVYAKRGMRINLGAGVFCEILFPETSVLGWDTNTSSIVLRLTYGEKSFLLTGDSPSSIEGYLTKTYGKGIKSTVLKLGHHGSRTSSSQEFLGFVDPEHVIISAGEDNKYGHPHKEVVDRLAAMNIPSLSTIDRGTIIFTTDGAELMHN